MSSAPAVYLERIRGLANTLRDQILSGAEPDALNGYVRTGGIAAVVATKTADLALTFTVLTLGVGYERNPRARWLVDVLGTGPGLLLGAALVVGVVVVATELGARVCRSYGVRYAVLARVVGYGGATLAVAHVVVVNVHAIQQAGGVA